MLALAPASVAAEAPGHVTGVGGVFFKSHDPRALMAWYRDVLGIRLEPWGGMALPADAPGHPPAVIVNAFPRSTTYFGPSPREFMLDFAVDDLTAFIARLRAKGVAILKRDDSDPSGSFAWIVDPEGTRIELWQPKPKPAPR